MYADRMERRNMDDNPGIIKLMHELNYFCFHSSGADDNCDDCCFEGNAPCPLAQFYNELEKTCWSKGDCL